MNVCETHGNFEDFEIAIISEDAAFYPEIKTSVKNGTGPGYEQTH